MAGPFLKRREQLDDVGVDLNSNSQLPSLGLKRPFVRVYILLSFLKHESTSVQIAGRGVDFLKFRVDNHGWLEDGGNAYLVRTSIDPRIPRERQWRASTELRNTGDCSRAEN